MKRTARSGIRLLFCSLVFSAAANAASQSYTVLDDSSRVEFQAVGKPGFLKIKGQGARLKGRLTTDAGGLKGDFTADLGALKTGVELRDRHMHDKYLESKTHPTAELTIESVAFDKGQEGSCTFTGKLTLKAVKKPIQGTCDISGLGKDTLQVKATSEIKLADYPIGVPAYLGVTVADTVSLDVVFSAVSAHSS